MTPRKVRVSITKPKFFMSQIFYNHRASEFLNLNYSAIIYTVMAVASNFIHLHFIQIDLLKGGVYSTYSYKCNL